MLKRARITKIETIEPNLVKVSCVVDRDYIVLVQAIIESYEGLATVRTEDKTGGVLAIVTPSAHLSCCQAVLGTWADEFTNPSYKE
jgi:hypothetical protein